MTKSELREIYLNKRKAISAAEHFEISHQIALAFFEKIDLQNVRSLNCFISLKRKGEVETKDIFARLWQDHPRIKTFAPRINVRSGKLESIAIDDQTNLVENKWRIPEPEGASTDPASLDLVIVPLLCFDESGYRVGYGKGFYDQFLAGCRQDCQKVGLSFFPPIEQIDDTSEFDIRLDSCITPSDSFCF
ncbi:MAG: 5-formyltetrahydrofolate cyclo-ligase [Acidobacteria bacterium]|nr:MAG: 5-formyltetrahydrofolate cyclo-ligase [Acidobacteriota bacterium]